MQAGTYGVVFPIQTDVDLSSVTAMTIRIIPPSGSNLPTVTHDVPTANIAQPPSQGLINYVIQNGDFPVDGLYQLELTDTTAGRNVPMSVVEIYLYPNL